MNHEAASEIGRARHEIARKRLSVTQCFETGYKCSTRIYLDKHKAPNHGPFFTVQKKWCGLALIFVLPSCRCIGGFRKLCIY